MGAVASAICAVHCLLTGVALSMLSVVGLGFLGSELVDFVFIATALAVGTIAVRHGITHHGSYVPALFFVLGLLSIIAGHFGFGHDHSAQSPYATVFSVIGGICLVLFHVVNWKLAKTSHCGCNHQR